MSDEKIPVQRQNDRLPLQTRNNTNQLYKEGTPIFNPVIGWNDDSKISQCTSCNIPFSFIWRKHHCRLCFKIYCWKCVDHFDIIPNENNNITKYRLCNSCFEITNKFK